MRIIPAPKEIDYKVGEFTFTKNTTFKCFIKNIASNFNDFLYKAYGFSLAEGNDIVCFIDDTLDINEEGYILVIDDIIKISARSEAGLFYGVQTLKQLVTEHYRKDLAKAVIQKLVVKDEPRFAYRGFMFDCARHFFPVEVIKAYIEAISVQKMNVFHWHLTEDQGWRIEISAYPKLTEVGSKRRETMGDKTPHEGYYSKKDVAEIVKYAADRYVTVIPEFDMPGHTRSAVASYPELGCYGKQVEVSTKFGIHKEILCGGKDSAYDFVYAVLKEFGEMFPARYVHLGGDEAIKLEWYNCPDCQMKIKELGLRDEEDLQGYMTNSAVNYLKTMDKTAICWNESANSGMLDESVVLQFWADGKENANVIREVKSGRKIIVSRFNPYYLDYPYSMWTLKETYEFEPVFKEISDYECNVLGVETPIWTEWVDNTDTLSFRVFPRLCAIAESGWSLPKNKDYEGFTAALAPLNKILALYGIKETPLKKCNPKKIFRPLITAKFGLHLIDFEMIVRSTEANKEMKKMRKSRQGENK